MTAAQLSREQFGNVTGIFGYPRRGDTTGIYWAAARDARSYAKCRTDHRELPHIPHI